MEVSKVETKKPVFALAYGLYRTAKDVCLVGAIGFEPTTPTMSRWCSNQLSYAPGKTEFYLKRCMGTNIKIRIVKKT